MVVVVDVVVVVVVDVTVRVCAHIVSEASGWDGERVGKASAGVASRNAVRSIRMSRSSDFPTVPPPFNVAMFARDYDAEVAAAAASVVEDDPGPQSELRLTVRPRIPLEVNDEDWARTATGALAVSMPMDELKRLPLDHRAGYLLSWMDGAIELDLLIEVSAMPRDEVLRIVRALIELRVVTCG